MLESFAIPAMLSWCLRGSRVSIAEWGGATATALASQRLGHTGLADRFVVWARKDDTGGIMSTYQDVVLAVAGLPTEHVDSSDDLDTLIQELFVVPIDSGRPVIAFHGVPACGAGFAFVDAPARERSVRVIAPDRPGVGLSTPCDGWTVGSYPAIVTGLADGLGVGRFAVWGWSGGGPYALACAATDPERVTSAVITAGMGEIGVWARDTDFQKADRQMLDMARKRPRLARMKMAATARFARISPTTTARSFAAQLSQSDRAVVVKSGTPAQAMALFTQAFLRGARGVIDDYRAIGQPWAVDLGAITTPTTIFHGDADPMVPARHAQELATRIPDAQLVIWPDEGHLAMVTHISDVIDCLVPASCLQSPARLIQAPIIASAVRQLTSPALALRTTLTGASAASHRRVRPGRSGSSTRSKQRVGAERL